ncbi:thiamine pyrophosphokinase [Yamadazyma tenuis]|uniref:Thiamine pyrophosphokinase n=1 Tax=Candida tenuis (strain ATCC 10573 / BCRC 21748 / CBS 615 / JCM 9827 / NBRC 10315 / NRRL Y-1498 / VKM Y-70) TaxID=590646 RepID=G3BAV0_CANTC|nr:uncharacterized protein CANTEDRAFT_109077 [Yamadazyma tenuis ATCC 10573]EGV61459.1 hypothetical protein CANTEDRAFT_109077 [Yamadazyma tenuis ATCC 10573]WEJ92671.1 thiamine pyrophosphokinase [Yamadazyma tenuis]
MDQEAEVIENPDNLEVVAPEDAHVIEPLIFKDREVGNSSLIVLNQEIHSIDLEGLWRNTKLHICADGGANRLFEYWKKHQRTEEFVPDFIVGDLDSLKADVQQFYEQHGCIVIPQYTQYASDFMKSMRLSMIYFQSETTRGLLYEPIESNKGLEFIQLEPAQVSVDMYILNGLGGRFDQTVHSINQVIQLAQQFVQNSFRFITPDDIVFLLRKGVNYIKYPSKQSFGCQGNPVCGMLPLNTEVVLNTRGLKWDVLHWPSSMGGHVSSSNALVGISGAVIECSNDMIINIEHSFN